MAQQRQSQQLGDICVSWILILTFAASKWVIWNSHLKSQPPIWNLNYNGSGHDLSLATYRISCSLLTWKAHSWFTSGSLWFTSFFPSMQLHPPTFQRSRIECLEAEWWPAWVGRLWYGAWGGHAGRGGEVRSRGPRKEKSQWVWILHAQHLRAEGREDKGVRMERTSCTGRAVLKLAGL